MDDLEAAISKAKLAVSATPEDHPGREAVQSRQHAVKPIQADRQHKRQGDSTELFCEIK
jgi:hypothetical protein